MNHIHRSIVAATLLHPAVPVLPYPCNCISNYVVVFFPVYSGSLYLLLLLSLADLVITIIWVSGCFRCIPPLLSL